ncbi:hypothetical protein Bca52824_026812 [Brassica carinata]|uniref:Arabidopsis retrotransposon Orf1 C-terminal domain-containing protein n=1 Tax=Brassica carinata TaxID=52824 RepID=A0A8X7V959_BRACI|nr:hypothetical protein Bca52824_026812 [Brassica carinata]
MKRTGMQASGYIYPVGKQGGADRGQAPADIEVEKQELAARHTAQFGKTLGSQPGSEEERRQQALAMIRKKAQAKKDGKRVVADKSVADGAHKQTKRNGKRTAVGDSVTDGAKQATPKRAKAPRNSSVGALVVEKTNKKHTMEEKLARARAKTQGKKPIVAESEEYDKRDRSKTPTKDELVDLLRNGITWVPTRFVHKMILQEMYFDDDVETMLEHMKRLVKFLALRIRKILHFPHSRQPKEKTIAESMWTLLTGKGRGGHKKEKNSSIRHPIMRYLHKLLNHTFFQKKEIGNVAGEELRFLHQTDTLLPFLSSLLSR